MAQTEERGFTLVEVMVAMVIIMIAIGSASLALIGTDNVETFNQQRAQAAQVLASQFEKDNSVAENTAWASTGPVGLPSSATYNVDGNKISVTLRGGWCEQTSDGTWVSYSGYVAPSPPPPPPPDSFAAYTTVIGYPMAWKEVATASWGHGQTMQLSGFIPVPINQPVQPTSSGGCPS
jgi:prepilin-type N-terminal cleavage/methylation domain-containing protein